MQGLITTCKPGLSMGSTYVADTPTPCSVDAMDATTKVSRHRESTPHNEGSLTVYRCCCLRGTGWMRIQERVMIRATIITQALAATVGAVAFVILAACSGPSAHAAHSLCTFSKSNELSTLSVSPVGAGRYAVYVGSQRPNVGYAGPVTYGSTRPIGYVVPPVNDVAEAMHAATTLERSVCQAIGS